MTAEERREKDIAEIISRLSGGRGHVRVQDAAIAAYEAGRSSMQEESAQVAEKEIGATRHEIAAAIRALKP